jgi:hypothetical protein
MEKILGISKLSSQNKLTLVETVQNKLEAMRGDLIIFYEENDKIFIRNQKTGKIEEDSLEAE